MRSHLVDQLCCPACRSALRLEAELCGHATGQIDSGRLTCLGCSAMFPIVRGIPRFVPSESYVASFGRQWTHYAVEQPEEDEETFETKTGFPLASLSGLDVLDAGCGGGRYTYVAARHGARVVAVDMSRAIDRAARHGSHLSNVEFIQADLLRLPLRHRAFDRAFSIGVLHHSSDAKKAFDQVAAAVRSGGQLAVWLYRLNTSVQECVNEVLRGITRRMSVAQLETIATIGAVLGSIPLVNRTLNKLVNFSNHPVWENRLCDTFDWYSPRFQSHHTVAELSDWFRSAGFGMLRELAPAKAGRLYRIVYDWGLIIGSGVNVVGTKS